MWLLFIIGVILICALVSKLYEYSSKRQQAKLKQELLELKREYQEQKIIDLLEYKTRKQILTRR